MVTVPAVDAGGLLPVEPEPVVAPPVVAPLPLDVLCAGVELATEL
jgi:hypothetical protein